MVEPGTPKPYKIPKNIESLSRTIVGALPGAFDVAFTDGDTHNVMGSEVMSEIEGEGSIQFENIGIIFPITIEISQIGGRETNIHLSVGKKPDIISLYLQFNSENASSVKVTTLIERLKRTADSSIPKGIGLEVYKLIPNLLSTLAKENNTEYRHEIERSKLSALTREKWLEIFGDFINEYGYEYTGDGKTDIWVKTYT